MRSSAFLAAVAAVSLGTAAWAQPHGAHPAAEAVAPSAAPRSADLQGDVDAFMNNRHMRAFYDLSVATLGRGAKKVDVPAYEQKAFAIFREFGVARGIGAAAMQDHLKLIPRQVVQIVKDDPSVLDSYESFTAAMVGPG